MLTSRVTKELRKTRPSRSVYLYNMVLSSKVTKESGRARPLSLCVFVHDIALPSKVTKESRRSRPLSLYVFVHEIALFSKMTRLLSSNKGHKTIILKLKNIYEVVERHTINM